MILLPIFLSINDSTPGKELNMTDKNQGVVERYTVRDAQNYKLGRFEFEKGILELKSEDDAEEFADLLAKSAVMVRSAIRKTDYAKAIAIVAAHRAKGSFAHQGGADSTTNRAQPNVPDMNKANEVLDNIPEGDPIPKDDKVAAFNLKK